MSPAWRSELKEWRPFLYAVLAIVVLAGGSYWLPRSSGYPGYSETELDKAIRDQDFTNITYLLPRYLPSDFEAATRKLRELGFGEGSRFFGARYRRRTVPEPNEVNEAERSTILWFNWVLSDNDAVALRRFWRRMPSKAGKGRWVKIFLLTKKDGTMKAIGSARSRKF